MRERERGREREREREGGGWVVRKLEREIDGENDATRDQDMKRGYH